MKTLEEFIKPSQRKLFHQLQRLYCGNTEVCEGEYLLVKGEAPILLVAHLDTVHTERVKTICRSADGNILMSPQGIGGDDRCGVYSLVQAYERSVKKPWLLFTCDEETGASGARAFVESHKERKMPQELDSLKCMVELDRKGSHDAVYYGCANDKFEVYIARKGFKTDLGTFSDISLLAPALGVAAVNLSAGYYNAHTRHEYINRSQLEAVITKVVEIIEEAAEEDFPRYDYVGRGRWGYVPSDVPKKYADLYRILLEYYLMDELEEWREIYGNTVLPELYEHAFGAPPYRRSRRKKGTGSDVDGHVWYTGEIPQTTSDVDRIDESGRTGQLPESTGPEQGSGPMAGLAALY